MAPFKKFTYYLTGPLFETARTLPHAKGAFMPDSSDLWYVRLPGGHVVRAASATLREQLASGRLSQLAEVRRSKEEAWRSMSCIDKSGELYNHRSRQSVAARLDPGTMNFLPINEFLEELLAALGCALSARKLQLTLIGFTGVGCGLLVSV
ncbi:MAG: hypothetical protein EBV06_11380 [Planctomycetia bacterium]|nr:hypothetical protein [Planctomycetia bacterium]